VFNVANNRTEGMVGAVTSSSAAKQGINRYQRSIILHIQYCVYDDETFSLISFRKVGDRGVRDPSDPTICLSWPIEILMQYR
jgi:hypothetical protein